MSGYLEMQDGRRVAVEDGLVLGRVKGCGLVIADAKASRRHARVLVEHGVVEVEDLQSSNGTQLNGSPVTRRMLRDGDVLAIGKTEITYRAGSMAVAPDQDEAGLDLSAELDEPDPDPMPPPTQSAPTQSAPAQPAPAEPPPAPDDFEVEIRAPQAKPAADPDVELLEFADDEVLTVRKPVGSRREAGPAAAGDMTAVRKDSGILQYNKVEDRGGILSLDFAQMSGPMRLLVLLLVLAGAAGLGYLAMNLV